MYSKVNGHKQFYFFSLVILSFIFGFLGPRMCPGLDRNGSTVPVLRRVGLAALVAEGYRGAPNQRRPKNQWTGALSVWLTSQLSFEPGAARRPILHPPSS
jgi:hypothetical protein